VSRAPDSPAGNDRAILDILDRDALIAAWRWRDRLTAVRGPVTTRASTPRRRSWKASRWTPRHCPWAPGVLTVLCRTVAHALARTDRYGHLDRSDRTDRGRQRALHPGPACPLPCCRLKSSSRSEQRRQPPSLTTELLCTRPCLPTGTSKPDCSALRARSRASLLQ